MTKSEEKTVLAMMRLVKQLSEATEKTSALVQRERFQKLDSHFRELDFESKSADRFTDQLYKLYGK